MAIDAKASSRSYAQEEIDATLGAARNDAERNISFALVVMLTLTAASSTVITGSGVGDNWLFPITLWVACALALARWLGIRKLGAVPWMRAASVAFDLLAPPLVFFVGAHGIPAEHHEAYKSLAANVPLAVLTMSMANTLRFSPLASIASAVGGCFVYVGILSYFGVMNWFMAPGVVMIAVSGLVSWTGAQRARGLLRRFARMQLLRRYLPSAAVERVMATDVVDALSVGGQQVTVTVIATDLRSFTSMSETLAPDEVVSQLNAYHAVMLEEVEQAGGVVDKFIGDGMLAVFGLEVQGGKLSSRQDAGAPAAVACARRMLTALDVLNGQRVKAGLGELKMGIGVHCGPVIAGNIGAPGRRVEFTVIGDTVNTAARLESATKELGFPAVVSGEVFAHLGEGIDGLCAAPPVQLRGRAQPVPIHSLQRA